MIASLRAEKKLYLILDIDQTILHTIPSIRLSEADMEFYDIVPITVDDQHHYVKLRPVRNNSLIIILSFHLIFFEFFSHAFIICTSFIILYPLL